MVSRVSDSRAMPVSWPQSVSISKASSGYCLRACMSSLTVGCVMFIFIIVVWVIFGKAELKAGAVYDALGGLAGNFYVVLAIRFKE